MKWRDKTEMTRQQLEVELEHLRRRISAIERRSPRQRAVVDATPLKAALDEAGWSQQTLADAAGVDQVSVSKWCSGRIRMRTDRAHEIVAIFVRQGATPPAFVFPASDFTCPHCQEQARPFYDMKAGEELCDRCHKPVRTA